jgi:CRP-like cAMP-binding protein
MPTILGICQNDLLNALPPEERERIFPHLEEVDMPLGKVIYESGGKMSHVYFPTTSIVSLLYAMENGSSAEIAIIGHEGIVGISLFMGGETTTSRAVVQSAGHAYQLKGQIVTICIEKNFLCSSKRFNADCFGGLRC